MWRCYRGSRCIELCLCRRSSRSDPSMPSSSLTGGSERTGNGSGHKNGAGKTGYSIWTMRLCKSLRLGSNFWPHQEKTFVLRSPYAPNLASCDFFLFSKVKIKFAGGGAKIWHGRGDSGRIVEDVEDSDIKGLPGLLPVLAEMSGTLCTIAGELLRSGRWWLRLWV
jgi:hypothetical protein